MRLAGPGWGGTGHWGRGRGLGRPPGKLQGGVEEGAGSRSLPPLPAVSPESQCLQRANSSLFHLRPPEIIGDVLCVNMFFCFKVKFHCFSQRTSAFGQHAEKIHLCVSFLSGLNFHFLSFLTFLCFCSLSNLFSHLSSVSLFSFYCLPLSTQRSLPSPPSPPLLSSLSMCSDYLSKLAISWLLYRDDVSLCPRVHQVGFLPLYLVKPKLTAGLVGVLLDLTKGLGLVLMRVNPVWFIAGLSKKINGSPFDSKSLIALCTYVSSLWIFFPLPSISCSLLSPFLTP